jgi:hypothetical protein
MVGVFTVVLLGFIKDNFAFQTDSFTLGSVLCVSQLTVTVLDHFR